VRSQESANADSTRQVDEIDNLTRLSGDSLLVLEEKHALSFITVGSTGATTAVSGS
jgi:hypothetical protein